MEYRMSVVGETVTAELASHFCGVGLIRGEFFFRKHGAYSTSEAPLAEIRQYLKTMSETFSAGELWYRLSDFWSDEANVLEGNKLILEEQNPLVGVRGVRRAFADQEHFLREINTLIDASKGAKNIGLLIPFVQDAVEFSKISRMCRDAGWDGQIGSMLEIPSALLGAKDFIDAGATNLLVGLNDLTSLFLGRERGDPSLKLHPTLWQHISALSKYAGSNVKWGIGGNMSAEAMEAAEQSGAHYVALHYGEISKLLNIDPSKTPDAQLVRQIKDFTNKHKAAYTLDPGTRAKRVQAMRMVRSMC